MRTAGVSQARDALLAQAPAIPFKKLIPGFWYRGEGPREIRMAQWDGEFFVAFHRSAYTDCNYEIRLMAYGGHHGFRPTVQL